jgi:hypothetical protein
LWGGQSCPQPPFQAALELTHFPRPYRNPRRPQKFEDSSRPDRLNQSWRFRRHGRSRPIFSQAVRVPNSASTTSVPPLADMRNFATNTQRPPSKYQNAITPSQFNGIATSLNTGSDSQGLPTLELVNAANVFDGSSTVSVLNAKCFFSPEATGWAKIQAALQSKTSAFLKVNSDPGCFQTHKQYLYKSSVGRTQTAAVRQPSFSSSGEI